MMVWKMGKIEKQRNKLQFFMQWVLGERVLPSFWIALTLQGGGDKKKKRLHRKMDEPVPAQGGGGGAL